MARREFVKGYEEFSRRIALLEKDSATKVIIYFTGDKNENGISWCPDCANAEPYISRAWEMYSKPDILFLTVEVGDKAIWKSQDNPFRSDPLTKLKVIPTIIAWKSVERLEDDECKNMNLLELFFSETRSNQS